MGLSFHYNGRFNKDADLSELITEIKEVAETFSWPFSIYLASFPDKKNESQFHDGKIYGISFTPPECETVSICFLSNYRMSSNSRLKFFGQTENPSESALLYMLSVKTQFAGTPIHKTIIELFRYLHKRKYFSELNIIDEGEYWETGDEKLLDKKFKANGDFIDAFSLAIESIPSKKSESFESYFERILKMIDEKNKNSYETDD